MLKKIIVSILIILMFCGVLYFEHNYTRYDCIVIDFSEEGALVEDRCGERWYIEEEGLQKGDLVDLKMYNNLTSAYIDDDIVKKVIVK